MAFLSPKSAFSAPVPVRARAIGIETSTDFPRIPSDSPIGNPSLSKSLRKALK